MLPEYKLILTASNRLRAETEDTEQLFTLLVVLSDEEERDRRVDDLYRELQGMRERLETLVMEKKPTKFAFLTFEEILL